MAKTAGGVRGGTKGRKSFSNDARSLFNDIERGYGRPRNYSEYETKKLQSLQRLGRNYNPTEKEKAINAYMSYANRVTGSQYRSITHASLGGGRSVLISVAHRAAAYRDLNAINDELKRRRKK